MKEKEKESHLRASKAEVPTSGKEKQKKQSTPDCQKLNTWAQRGAESVGK